jgi:hypothetical protein
LMTSSRSFLWTTSFRTSSRAQDPKARRTAMHPSPGIAAGPLARSLHLVDVGLRREEVTLLPRKHGRLFGAECAGELLRRHARSRRFERRRGPGRPLLVGRPAGTSYHRRTSFGGPTSSVSFLVIFGAAIAYAAVACGSDGLPEGTVENGDASGKGPPLLADDNGTDALRHADDDAHRASAPNIGPIDSVTKRRTGTFVGPVLRGA